MPIFKSNKNGSDVRLDYIVNVDSSLDPTSKNPIQNKVVAEEINTANENISSNSQKIEENKNAIVELTNTVNNIPSTGNVDIASTDNAGIVKPDGETITIDEDGTIHSNGTGNINVDDCMSETSENPVQNKVVTAEINFNKIKYFETQKELDDAIKAGEITDGEYFALKEDSASSIPSSPTVNSAAAHNAIFRGKDLTEVYTKDQIYERINNGTFEDLYIGDYFDIDINGECEEKVRCIFAGFDTYLHNGKDNPLEVHHAVIVTKNCLSTLHQMNTTDTAAGGFLGSDIWNTVIPIYNTAFENVFGEHLLSHEEPLTNSVYNGGNSNACYGFTGYANDWSWVNVKLNLLSEINVYGCNLASSSFYDVGINNLQLPLFAFDPTAKVCCKGGVADVDVSNRQWYWLRNVASYNSFAQVSRYGSCGFYDASDFLGVRPIFCIG